jgi:hypothetical protein
MRPKGDLMRRRSRLILAGLAATLLMGLATSTASANRLSVGNTKFRITWGTLFIVNDPNFHSRCPITLEGSFHSATIRKVARALIGSVTRGIVKNDSCPEGHFTVLQEKLPWHLTFEAFTGTLPTILGFEALLSRYSFQVEYGLSITCLYHDRGSLEENIEMQVLRVGGVITTVTPNEKQQGEFVSGSIGCPRESGITGVGQAFLLGNTTRIALTLI